MSSVCLSSPLWACCVCDSGCRWVWHRCCCHQLCHSGGRRGGGSSSLVNALVLAPCHLDSDAHMAFAAQAVQSWELLAGNPATLLRHGSHRQAPHPLRWRRVSKINSNAHTACCIGNANTLSTSQHNGCRQDHRLRHANDRWYHRKRCCGRNRGSAMCMRWEGNHDKKPVFGGPWRCIP